MKSCVNYRMNAVIWWRPVHPTGECGLRDYGIEPVVWDGEPGCDCEHEWGKETKSNQRIRHGEGNTELKCSTPVTLNPSTGQFCSKCNAWLGSYGLEPRLELYVQHTVQIFREVRRVMRKDSTLFLNLGDSYAGSGSPGGDFRDGKGGDEYLRPYNRKGNNLKPKDLCGIPWLVAFALQADGWWLRSDIIWAKPNPMPESCRDRPTKSHEYLFLLAKSGTNQYWTHRDKDGVRIQPKPDYRWIHIDTGEERTTAPAGWTPKNKGGWRRVNLWDGHDYFYDADAIREKWTDERPADIKRALGERGKYGGKHTGENSIGYEPYPWGDPNTGRNKRTVWTIATEPFPDAHFAVYPRRLVAPCILAGTSEAGVCAECGAPWERVVEVTHYKEPKIGKGGNKRKGLIEQLGISQHSALVTQELPFTKTIGWRPTCACNAETAHAVVLDPFIGSGTTAVVAKSLNRDFIGIEINREYIKMAEKRLSAVQPNLELI